MSASRCLFLLCLLAILPATNALARSADIECAHGRSPVAAGVVASVRDRGGELRWIDLIWLTEDDTDRLREFVTIDFRNKSVSPVRVYDVSVQSIVEPDVGDTQLVADRSDFDAGRITLDLCMDSTAVHGVAIAYHQIGFDEHGKPRLRGLPTAFEVEGPDPYFSSFRRWGRWTAISLDFGSQLVTRDTSTRLLNMAELATGVRPEEHVGGSMIIESAGLANNEPHDFIDPRGGYLFGRQFFVTGPSPSVLASPAVTSVRFQGEELLGEDGLLLDLSADRSPLRVSLGEEPGAPSYLLYVIDGRLGAEIDPGSCVNGAPITGRLTRTTVDDGLSFLSAPLSLSARQYVTVTNGAFEIPATVCGQERLLLTSSLSDQLYLAFGDSPGSPIQAELCPTFSPSPGEGFPCITLPTSAVAELLEVPPTDIAGGENFFFICEDSRGGVDTIDTFLAAAESTLAPADFNRLMTILRSQEGTLDDQDGDASVCNVNDLKFADRIISTIRVNVVLNAPHDGRP